LEQPGSLKKTEEARVPLGVMVTRRLPKMTGPTTRLKTRGRLASRDPRSAIGFWPQVKRQRTSIALGKRDFVYSGHADTS